MSIDRFGYLLAVVISFIVPSTARGITLGQVDTFEDGTAQGWITSSGTTYGVPQLGGPAGGSDHYLPILAGGSGLGLNWFMSNLSQWSGNYLAAGVTGIEMDLKYNTPLDTPPPLPIRIAIRESTAAGNTKGYSSTTAFNLPDDSQWHHVSISLAPADLTPINSPQPLASDLANVVDFLILSSPNPATIPDSGGLILAGIDNIRAIPEPSTICLAMSATIGLILFRRRCSKF